VPHTDIVAAAAINAAIADTNVAVIFFIVVIDIVALGAQVSVMLLLLLLVVLLLRLRLRLRLAMMHAHSRQRRAHGGTAGGQLRALRRRAVRLKVLFAAPRQHGRGALIVTAVFLFFLVSFCLFFALTKAIKKLKKKLVCPSFRRIKKYIYKKGRLKGRNVKKPPGEERERRK
jgi:hypothetical protein